MISDSSADTSAGYFCRVTLPGVIDIPKMCSMDPVVGSKAAYGRTWLYPSSVTFSNWDKLRALVKFAIVDC
jgi:hypothetical protein